MKYVKNRPLHWFAAALLSSSGAAALPVAVASGLPAPSTASSFTPHLIVLGGAPQRIGAGDLDGDGDADLVVLASSAAAATLTVLRNDGNDSVTSSVTTSFLPTHLATSPFLETHFVKSWVAELVPGIAELPPDVEVNDLDGDGDLDLLRCIPGGGTSSLSSHLNAGDGTFDVVVTSLMASPLRLDTALADLNADGVLDYGFHELDLIGYIGTREGNGNGSFQAFGPDVPIGSGAIGLNIAIGELTEDALHDMVMASSNGIALARGEPGTPIPTWSNLVELLAPGNYGDVALADLDGNLRLDVVGTRSNHGQVLVLLGQPGGGLGSPALFDAGPAPDAVTVADIRLDSVPDVIVTNQERGLVTVLHGDGSGALMPPVSFFVTGNPSDIASADLDGDGDVDLAVTDYRDGTVTVLFNKLIP